MQIAEARESGVHVLAPTGRIDTTTVGLLEGRLAALLAQPHARIVIDLSEVEYISSAGLRILLIAGRRVQDAAGGLVLCGMGHAVRQVFYLAGFLPLFTIAETRAIAVGQLAP